MTSNENNPYHNPYDAPKHGGANMAGSGLGIPAADTTKIEAIAKDAGQFWLAILICIVCSSIGTLLITPWYGVRLAQWYSMKNRYPQLMDPHAPPKSLAKRFQSAQVKLMIGIVFGIVMLFFGMFIILALIAGGAG